MIYKSYCTFLYFTMVASTASIEHKIWYNCKKSSRSYLVTSYTIDFEMNEIIIRYLNDDEPSNFIHERMSQIRIAK